MNLKQALIKNTSWNFIGLLSTFVNNILVVRMLGAEQSGSFYYSIAVLVLFVIFLRFGLENGFTYYAAKFPSSTSFLLFLLLPLSVLQWGLFYLILVKFEIVTIHFSPFWASTFVAANISLYYITAFFHARKQFSAINIISCLIAFLQTVILMYYLLTQDVGGAQIVNTSFYDKLFVVLTTMTVLQVLSAFVTFLIQNKNLFKTYRFSKTLLGRLGRYSGFNYLNALLVFLGTRTDFYFIERYCELGVLGNYIQAAKISQFGMILPGLIGGVVFPFAISSGNAFREKVASLCRMVSSMFILIFLGILIFGHFLFPLLLGKEFILVYQMVLVMIIGIACMGLSIILISYFEGKNLQKVILYANGAMLFMIVTGDYLFVKKYGYMAAASIFTTGNLIGFSILLYFFVKQTGLKIAALFFIRRADLVMIFSHLKG